MRMWDCWQRVIGNVECGIAVGPCAPGFRESVCGGSGQLGRSHVCGVEASCAGCILLVTFY